jgi:hypothetical protein
VWLAAGRAPRLTVGGHAAPRLRELGLLFGSEPVADAMRPFLRAPALLVLLMLAAPAAARLTLALLRLLVSRAR